MKCAQKTAARHAHIFINYNKLLKNQLTFYNRMNILNMCLAVPGSLTAFYLTGIHKTGLCGTALILIWTLNVTSPMSDGGVALFFYGGGEMLQFRQSDNTEYKTKDGGNKMPETKFQSIVFTAITAWIMVYIMTLYNTVLAAGSFTNATFLTALKGMWIEYVIIFLCAFFISSRLAKLLAFRVVKPGDRPIAIILTIQVFTVVIQVALASVLGVYHGYGFTAQFIPNYLATYCRNFVMALPVQLLIAGPIARFIFRAIFVKGKKKVQN